VTPDERAVALAARVADGSEIDWRATESARTADRDSVQNLRAIAALAALHRRTMGPRAAEGMPDGLGSWGSLLLLDRIGAGRFGDVYRAWDTRLDRHVALKLLRTPVPADRGLPDRAIEEGRLLARVRHPNVLTVYGAECRDGRIGIWTEFVEGQTLETILLERGPMDPDEVIAIGIDLSRAVAAVHDAGLLHRDVKAQNVMREVGGRIVLMDFGTGHDAEQGPARDGDLSGTPLYLAPEVFTGSRPSVASDVYALAVLLFYLLTGRHPVTGRTLDDVRAGHRERQPERLGDTRPDLPDAFSATIDRGLAVDPARRYDSARAFETALEKVQAVSTQSDRARAPRWTLRPKRLANIALAVMLGALSVGYVTLHRTSKAAVAFQARDWVLVTTFDNRTGDPQFNGTLEHALSYELSNSTFVNVVPRERVDDAQRLMARPPTPVVDAADGSEVALRDGGIRLVLDGIVERLGTGYAMTVRIIEPHTAATIATDREEAPTAAAVPSAVRRLSDRIRVTLGEAPVTVTQDDQRLEKVTTPSLRALQTYSEAVHVFNLDRFTEAEALLESALTDDPGFASAHLRMAWTLKNLGRPRDVVIASARRAADLINTVTERERYPILGAYYWMTNQNELAIGQFEALASRYPDDTEGLANLQDLYQQAGRWQAAAELTVRIADAQPNDFFARVRAADAVLQSRDLEAARPQATRAMELLAAAPDQPAAADYPAKSWVLMFPVHDLWVQGRAKEAAALLDTVGTRPELAAEGRSALFILGKLRLALGQVRLAEGAYSRIPDPALRALGLSEVALARGDRPAVAAQLSAHPGTDLATISLLVRAGDLDAADSELRRVQNFNPPTQVQWAAQEIAEARGDPSLVKESLKTGVPWTVVMFGMRAFLYSETLARAAIVAGDTAGAIRVLEETGPLGDKAYAPVTQSGYYWMRTQKLLADVYRQTGQFDKARAIERHLLARLAAADDDYPMLLELKARDVAAPGRGTLTPR
jgi:serine/threonine protein kinase/tetratricopeptide (TPR) repeat protein